MFACESVFEESHVKQIMLLTHLERIHHILSVEFHSCGGMPRSFSNCCKGMHAKKDGKYSLWVKLDSDKLLEDLKAYRHSSGF